MSEQKESSLLPFTIDVYNSVHVGPDNLPTDSQQFENSLIECEKQWRDQGKKAIWIQINANQSNLFDKPIKLGYEMHHATKEYLMLSKWLIDGEVSRLPGYTTHYIGCGGAVINRKREVLLVSEKSGYNKGYWSLPGGRADPNEMIEKTAEREIFEELGLKCKAKNLFMLRESTRSLFGKPDIYFAFLLIPEGEEEQEVKMCVKELSDFKWVQLSQLEDFIKNEAVSPYHLQRFMLQKLIDLYKAGFNFEEDTLNQVEHRVDYPFPKNNYSVFCTCSKL